MYKDGERIKSPPQGASKYTLPPPSPEKSFLAKKWRGGGRVYNFSPEERCCSCDAQGAGSCNSVTVETIRVAQWIPQECFCERSCENQQFTYGVVRKGVIAEKFPQNFREVSKEFLHSFCKFPQNVHRISAKLFLQKPLR